MRFPAFVLATIGLASGCLSTPARPRDDAAGPSIDGAIDAPPGNAPVFASRAAAMTQAVASKLEIPPPADTTPGDLVVLYLDRFWATSPAPALNGWHSIADETNDGDALQILWRTAQPDEATQQAAYTFDAGTLGTPPDCVWVLDVWHGATSAKSLYSTANPTPSFTPMFPAAMVASNEIVVDASVASYETTCDQPAGTDDRQLWALLINPPGDVPAVTFTCTLEQPFSRFQIRIVP